MTRPLLLLAVVLLAACAAEPLPPERFFRLEPPLPSQRLAFERTIFFEPVRANGVYN